MPDDAHLIDAPHRDFAVKAILGGRVVPFLGAGASIAGRPDGVGWFDGALLPKSDELAKRLADEIASPPSNADELMRVSQYIALTAGTGPLFQELHTVFERNYGPGPVHRFLAEIEVKLESLSKPRLLIVTTNYDDAMEQALSDAGVVFDVVSYMSHGKHRGRFVHWQPGAPAPIPITKPNTYTRLSLGDRAVVLKIHGAVARSNPEWESFVITEDDYIDYLTRTKVESLIPMELLTALRTRSLFFMGYRLEDWNLRVIFQRIWQEQELTYGSWAVQRECNPIDQLFWESHRVKIIESDLVEYLECLRYGLFGTPVVAQ